MIGRSHVVCAAAGWALVAPPVAALLGHPLEPIELAASLAVAAGAGVGPDIDHPEATIARTHGIASKAVAEIVCAVTGGHRRATHWLVTGIGVGLAVTAAGMLWARWTLAVALALCGAWALRVLIPDEWDRWFWAPTAAAFAGWLAYRHLPSAAWVGAAVGFGWCAHILCDWVCSGTGVPLLGPFDRDRYAAGLFAIAGPVERLVALAASTAVVLLVGRQLFP